MSDFGWICAKIRAKLPGGGKETLNKYLRKQGMTIGQGTKTASQLKTAEPYLITIGDNVTISHGVDFITHDNFVCKIYGVLMEFYNTNWEKMPFVYSYPQNPDDTPKPECLDEMLSVAEQLATGFHHVRVDFYLQKDGGLKVGELHSLQRVAHAFGIQRSGI